MLKWVDDFSPLVFYVLASIQFYRLAHIRGHYWKWVWGWACFTGMAICLSVGRILTILITMGFFVGDTWFMVRTYIVIMAALLMCAGATILQRIFLEGTE